jgi:hypothetical protein
MKVSIKGRDSKGATVWMTDNGYWSTDSKQAAKFPEKEAERKLRINNANNRFLDPEDRIEASVGN